MPYVSLDNLARFHGRLRGRASSEFASLGMANWQKTAAAGAVSFSPVPEMPLDPVVNFLFTETGPASGTKGPDNPSTITGVTQAKVTRCGKNLLMFPYYSSSFTSNGVTFTVASDGTVSTSGTASGDVDFYIASSSNGPWLSSGLSYTLSGCPSGGSTSTYYMRHSAYPTAADTGSGATFTASASGKPAQPIIIRIKSGTNTNNLVFKPQLELGSAATSFEPYEGADYTISLGGTYYGGSVDLSTGVMTMTWTAVRLGDFQNSLQYNSANNRWEIFVTPKADYSINAICTHSIFKYGSEFTDATDGVFRWAAGNLGQWLWFKSPAATKEAFLAIYENAYVAFALAPSYTVSLTPLQIYSLSQPDPYTPRINTVYSDQVSVQVGYPKSPQATATELTNAFISLGGEI